MKAGVVLMLGVAFGIQLKEVSNDTRSDDTRSNDPCLRYASFSTKTTNVQCQTRCRELLSAGWDDPSENENFGGVCRYQHYELNEANQLVFERGGCFQPVIYGVLHETEPNAYQWLALNVETPAACQGRCQLQDGCVHWVYFPGELNPTARTNYCYMKSAEYVEGAINNVAQEGNQQGNPLFNPRYCTRETQLYYVLGVYSDLIACNGSARCIMVKKDLIGGWKYCHCESPTELGMCKVPTFDW